LFDLLIRHLAVILSINMFAESADFPGLGFSLTGVFSETGGDSG
jgi:hypothetical protein